MKCGQNPQIALLLDRPIASYPASHPASPGKPFAKLDRLLAMYADINCEDRLVQATFAGRELESRHGDAIVCLAIQHQQRSIPMSDLGKTLNAEIRRLARREANALVAPIHKALTGLRRGSAAGSGCR